MPAKFPFKLRKRKDRRKNTEPGQDPGGAPIELVSALTAGDGETVFYAKFNAPVLLDSDYGVSADGPNNSVAIELYDAVTIKVTMADPFDLGTTMTPNPTTADNWWQGIVGLDGRVVAADPFDIAGF